MAHSGPEFEPNHEGRRRRVAIGLFVAATLGMMAVLSLPVSQLINVPLPVPGSLGSGLSRGAETLGPLLGGVPFVPPGAPGVGHPSGATLAGSVGGGRLSPGFIRSIAPVPPNPEVPAPPVPPLPEPPPKVPGGPNLPGPDGTTRGPHGLERRDAAHCQARRHRCHREDERMEMGKGHLIRPSHQPPRRMGMTGAAHRSHGGHAVGWHDRARGRARR